MKVDPVSQIKLFEKLAESRETEIESCFSSEIKIHYPQTEEELTKLVEDFKRYW